MFKRGRPPSLHLAEDVLPKIIPPHFWLTFQHGNILPPLFAYKTSHYAYEFYYCTW